MADFGGTGGAESVCAARRADVGDGAGYPPTGRIQQAAHGTNNQCGESVRDRDLRNHGNRGDGFLHGILFPLHGSATICAQTSENHCYRMCDRDPGGAVFLAWRMRIEVRG